MLTEGISHEENWSFYPNAVRTAGFCGNPSFHLYWPNKKKDKTHNILSSRELIIQPGYMMQFKVRNVLSLQRKVCNEKRSSFSSEILLLPAMRHNWMNKV